VLRDGRLGERQLVDDVGANTAGPAREDPQDLDPRRVPESLREAGELLVGLVALDRPKVGLLVGRRATRLDGLDSLLHRRLTIFQRHGSVKQVQVPEAPRSMAESNDDLLGRKLAELAAERDLFEAVIQSMDDAVLVVDAEQRIIAVNRSACELVMHDMTEIRRLETMRRDFE
jgi:PAS domain-containing protein